MISFISSIVKDITNSFYFFIHHTLIIPNLLYVYDIVKYFYYNIVSITATSTSLILKQIYYFKIDSKRGFYGVGTHFVCVFVVDGKISFYAV